MAESVCTPTSAQSPASSSAGAAGITFRPTGWKGYAHSSDGTLSAGAMVSIHAAERRDEIDLNCIFGGHACGMRFSAADARAIAAELVAAAAAIDAAQGRA